jgi:hypothetical protein
MKRRNRSLSPALARSHCWSRACQRHIAGDGAKVEEDRGIEEIVRGGAAHPSGKLPAPLRHRQAPARISGHHVALAKGKAAGIEHLIDPPCKGQETLAEGFGVPLRLGHEDNPVVLIGVKRLLQAPLGTKGQPAPGHQGQLELGFGQINGTQHHEIIKDGDPLADVGGGSVFDPSRRRFAHPVGGLRQGGDVGGRVNGLDQILHVEAAAGVEINTGHQTGQGTAAVHHHQMAQVVTGQGQAGLVSAGRQGQRHHPTGHDAGNRLTQIRAGQHDPLNDIPLGEHPQGPRARTVDDHDHIGPLRHHPRQSLPHRGLGPHGHRRTP